MVGLDHFAPCLNRGHQVDPVADEGLVTESVTGGTPWMSFWALGTIRQTYIDAEGKRISLAKLPKEEHDRSSPSRPPRPTRWSWTTSVTDRLAHRKFVSVAPRTPGPEQIHGWWCGSASNP